MRLFLICILIGSYLFAADQYNTKDSEYAVRVYYGKSSMSDLKDILTGEELEQSYQKNDVYGVSFEKYAIRELFDLPIDFTYQGGLFYHHQTLTNANAPYQEPNKLIDKNVLQVNFGIKLYWTKFPWDRWMDTRLFVMDGLSYVSDYLNVETEDSNKNGRGDRSRLLNYLELGFEFGVGDLFEAQMLENVYLGVGISHRSGVFGLFNGVRGGSNTVFVSIGKDF